MDRKSVAIIRVGALGDLLVALPAILEAMNAHPDKDIYIVGSPLWLDLLDPVEWKSISGIITVPRRGGTFELFRSSQNSGWQKDPHSFSISQFYKSCFAVYNLRQESLRFSWGPWLQRVPIRKGSCYFIFKWIYTHWSPWLGKEPMVHERDRMLRIIEAPPNRFFPLQMVWTNRKELANSQTRDSSTPVKVNKNLVDQIHQDKSTLSYKWAKKGLPRLRPNADAKRLKKYISSSKKFILINPTSSRWEKAWPKENFKELVAMLAPFTKKIDILIIGSPQESNWLQEVAHTDTPVIQPQTLSDLIDIVSSAEFLLTNTSSMQYISATTGTPTHVLMGRTDPIRWGPVGENDTFTKGSVPPQFRGNIFLEDYEGYKSISVQSIFKTVSERIDSIILPAD